MSVSALLSQAFEALISTLLQRIQETVAETLDAQTRPPKLMTESRLCSELLDVSSPTVRNRLLPEGLPHMMVGDARRYDPDEVLAWLRARRGASNETDGDK